MHLTCFGVRPAGQPVSKAIHGRVASIGIDPPRPIFPHVAIIPDLVARDKACPLEVLALRNPHAVDGEEDVLLAADCGNFAGRIPTLPTSRFFGLDASRIAHSGTGVGPVNDRAGDQATDEKPLATHGQTIHRVTFGKRRRRPGQCGLPSKSRAPAVPARPGASSRKSSIRRCASGTRVWVGPAATGWAISSSATPCAAKLH
jgi:hypothetical protein